MPTRQPSDDVTQHAADTTNDNDAVNFAHYPIKTIGILGGGQLGLMLAQAALPLGLRCVFLEDAPFAPARLLGKVYSTEQFEDFARAADVYTLEFENTPVCSARLLAQTSALYPPPDALAVAQDRLKEKALFNQLDISTVPYQQVSNQADLRTACEALGVPLVLKTSHGGYDGKGQFVVQTLADIDAAWAELGDAVNDAPLIAEGFIHFEREVSIIAARDQHGNVAYYPLVENHHHQGMLAKTTAPAPDSDALTTDAQAAIKKLLEHLDYVGVLALELFVTQDGLLANEIAPRVHNSGHWSIEGAVTSQFENHIRAVAGLPLGDTRIVQPSVMLNIIGEYPDLAAATAVAGAHVHLYDKEERDERKIGHITVMPTDRSELAARVAEVVACLPNTMGL
ncbi:5-(carboxyamino)imidazole ribonucleotide synthase [Faucicola atlantae]|nr:5-(carboxyamino)imidazole ribonucleotide synthase [Moraxella atlantae]